jgi:hypothetical protein
MLKSQVAKKESMCFHIFVMDKVVHFEVPADDVARAQNFYASAFGWKITAVPDMDYWLVQTADTDENGMLREAGGINGGMMKKERHFDHPIITIDVVDIDGSLKKIEELGGKAIGEKMRVGSMGYSAYFKDTEGNIMGLWQNFRKA